MLGDIMKKSFFIVGVFLVLVIFYGFYAFKEEEQNSITHNVIIVKIDGAIKVPGTYEVSPTTKLEDLIFYAGGLKASADIEKINKDEYLKSNSNYYIPFKKIEEEELPTENLININTATKEELMTLPGIGPTKAEAIIDYRNKNGLFKELIELMNVSGIGEKTYEQLLEKITI